MKNQNNGSPVVQVVAAIYLAAAAWMVVELARTFRAQRKSFDTLKKIESAEAELKKKAGAA